MGLLFPHKTWEIWFVAVQSLVCETGELLAGERARFIVDPGVNVLGYLLGCAASMLLGRGRVPRRESLLPTSNSDDDAEGEDVALVGVIVR